MNIIKEVGISEARSQSAGEEIANSVSHGLGLLAAVAGTLLLLAAALSHSDTTLTIAVAVFGLTMLLLYGTSTLYHAWPRTRMKQVLRTVDHAAIFLLIAGSYTPFTLGPLRGPWGWVLLGVVWGLAGLGVTLKMMRGVCHPKLSLFLYLSMGWLILVAIRPLWLHLPMPGFLWVVAGGVAYTGGVVFYAAEHVRYGHFVWHLFVLAGTACHFLAVLWYVA